MNENEELAIMHVIGAPTLHARANAIKEMLRLKGLRISPALRGFMTTELSKTNDVVALRPQPSDGLMRRLDHGPAPLLAPDAERKIVEWVDYWEAARIFGPGDAEPPGPLLLHGPPGTGKTMATKWIASLMPERVCYIVDAYEIVASLMGESASKLEKRFSSLNESTIAMFGPALVLEEIDTIATVRGGKSSTTIGEENRTTVALMRLVEAARFPVVMTTNRCDALDPALLRRCDEIVELAEPDLETRRRILSEICPDAASLDMGRPFVDLVRDAKQMRRRARIEKVRASREHP